MWVLPKEVEVSHLQLLPWQDVLGLQEGRHQPRPHLRELTLQSPHLSKVYFIRHLIAFWEIPGDMLDLTMSKVHRRGGP